MLRRLLTRRWRVSGVTVRLPLIDVSLRPEDEHDDPAPSARRVTPLAPPSVAPSLPPVSYAAPLAPPDDAFERLRAAMAAESYSLDQLALFQAALPHAQFTASQVCALVDTVHYAEEKLELVRLALPRLTDPENAYLLPSRFPYFEDKQRVQKLIAKAAR